MTLSRHARRLLLSVLAAGCGSLMVPALAAADNPGQTPASDPAFTYVVTPTSTPSLQDALNQAQPGQMIEVLPGSYPAETFNRWQKGATSSITVVGVGDAEIGSVTIAGGQHLTLDGLHFTSGIHLRNSMNAANYATDPAADISVLNSTFDCGTAPTATSGTAGFSIRAGAQNILFSGNLVQHCVNGFVSVAQDVLSENVQLVHNTFQDLSGDAIDVGAQQNMTIQDNLIQDIGVGCGCNFHHDGIQFLGHTDGTTISRNVIANSADQEIFIQDAVAPAVADSVGQQNENITVEDNLVYGADAFEVQDQGGQNVSFVDNTFEYALDGTLLLRQSGYTGLQPTGLIEANIIGSSTNIGDRGYVTVQDNLLPDGSATACAVGGFVCGTDPAFNDPAAGDFSPTSSSPQPASVPAAADLYGNLPAAGPYAYGAIQFGSPAVQYGAPMWGTP